MGGGSAQQAPALPWRLPDGVTWRAGPRRPRSAASRSRGPGPGSTGFENESRAPPGAAPPLAPLARPVAVELARAPFLAPAGLPQWQAPPEEASRPTALLAAQGKAFAETLASRSPEPGTSRQLELLLRRGRGRGSLGVTASSTSLKDDGGPRVVTDQLDYRDLLGRGLLGAPTAAHSPKLGWQRCRKLPVGPWESHSM